MLFGKYKKGVPDICTARFGEWHPLHRGLNGRCPSVFRGAACMYRCGEIYTLRSYGLVVCQCDPATGKFHRCWSGWSKTTSRHLRYFLEEVCPGVCPPTKQEWEDMDVVPAYFVAGNGRGFWEASE